MPKLSSLPSSARVCARPNSVPLPTSTPPLDLVAVAARPLCAPLGPWPGFAFPILPLFSSRSVSLMYFVEFDFYAWTLSCVLMFVWFMQGKGNGWGLCWWWGRHRGCAVLRSLSVSTLLALWWKWLASALRWMPRATTGVVGLDTLGLVLLLMNCSMMLIVLCWNWIDN